MGLILDWAIAAGERKEANPVAQIRAGRALPKQGDVPSHFAAIDWRALPALYAELTRREATSAACLRFIILTACRSGEARGALWPEFDLDAAIWRIPRERKKERRGLDVPLSAPCLALLMNLPGPHDGLVFRAETGRALSINTFQALFRRMGRTGITTHGMRSAFSTWRAETDAASREIAEMCLGHRVGSGVERAYQRSDLLARRRDLMDKWADFCISEVCAHV